MDFGEAIRAAKSGAKIGRSGWNGKGMFLVYQKAYPNGITINANTAEATGIPQGTSIVSRPYLMMKAVDGAFFPWNPNQLDMLSEDWEIIEAKEKTIVTSDGSATARTDIPAQA